MVVATETRYAMESPTEGNRLERKTRKEDSVKQLEMVGLARGMRILDCGCGTGAVSRVMAEFVGPKGHVLGIDRSEDRLAQAKRLAEGAGRHLEFKQRSLDLPPDDSEKESFDVVWSRFVFEYLPSPEKTMANLLSYLKPGGTLVIGDLDCNGVIHYPASPALEEGLGHLVSSLEGLYDPYTGRKIFSWFRNASMNDIQVHVAPYHLYPGTAPQDQVENWDEKFRVLRDVVGARFPSLDSFDNLGKVFLEHLRSPDVFSYTTLVLVWGKKAGR